jgi:ABC-type amino acid transport system permease subunit
MDLRWEILAGYGPLFWSGLLTTIELTLVAIGAGLVLGVLFGLSAVRPTRRGRLRRRARCCCARCAC